MMPASRTFSRGLSRLSCSVRSAPSPTLSAITRSTPKFQPRVSLPTRTSSTSICSRGFSTTVPNRHGHLTEPKPGEELWVTFIDKEGVEHKIAVCEGDNLLDIAQGHDLEMEGACGGSCACSTCHVIVKDEEFYDKMPEPEDDENDMLDLAFSLTETSRLGCQVKMTKDLDGLVVKLPSMTRNLQASDFK
ncbi:2Fe-2S ferredoxin-type domain-containing protein [Stachybotrys elegans]|uniref:2Fe-2S ferredoxin-type domain-containing protein n=1 Tax=Stachybotrys elegans TaxID=80388 RepID=A0A8K0SM33_9HYPO|nr:2Fe-2S ferredoxin-type domain-containing protein [Stachybotrys elegans]